MIERRQFSQDFMDKVVAEALAPGALKKDILNKYELVSSVLSRWIRVAQQGKKPRKNAIHPTVTPPTVIHPTIKDSGGELGRLRTEIILLKALLSHYMKEHK